MSGAKLGSLHKQTDTAELSIIVNKIISDIHNLKQGEYFHCVSVSAIHDTQLMIRKEKDGSFTLYHYNIGEGSIQQNNQSVMKITGISESAIADTNFWTSLIANKLGELSTSPLYECFMRLGPFETDHIEPMAIRRLQGMNVCTFESILTMLKHQLVTHSPSPTKGVEQFSHIEKKPGQ